MIYMINSDDLNTSLVINYNQILNIIGYNYKEILDDFIANHSIKDKLGYDVVNFGYLNDFKRSFPELFKIIMRVSKVKTM
nr:MAG TPA: hypothetical protein [Caudoviricetes sp.]